RGAAVRTPEGRIPPLSRIVVGALPFSAIPRPRQRLPDIGFVVAARGEVLRISEASGAVAIPLPAAGVWAIALETPRAIPTPVQIVVVKRPFTPIRAPGRRTVAVQPVVRHRR